jgi:hypothetical protein
VLDGDPGRVGEVAHGGKGARELARLVDDLHHRSPLGRRPPEEVAGGGDVVGPEHGVHIGRPLLDRTLVLLGHAPPDRNLHAGAAVLDRLQVPEVAVQLVVGVLPDRAGVQDDHIGILGGGGRDEAVGLEEAGDALAVMGVHLTPEGADEVGAAHRTRLRATSTTPGTPAEAR